MMKRPPSKLAGGALLLIGALLTLTLTRTRTLTLTLTLALALTLAPTR